MKQLLAATGTLLTEKMEAAQAATAAALVRSRFTVLHVVL